MPLNIISCIQEYTSIAVKSDQRSCRIIENVYARVGDPVQVNQRTHNQKPETIYGGVQGCYGGGGVSCTLIRKSEEWSQSIEEHEPWTDTNNLNWPATPMSSMFWNK